jgi:LmbE family N-acetylglucosaminyl deacetylase
MGPAARAKDAARRAARAIEDTKRAAWRARVISDGVDVTSRSAAASCLVLAPHPDDETIGCGATIARKRAAGTPVRVVVVADGRSSHRSTFIGPDELARIRADEVVRACRELGVDEADLVRLEFPDESLAARSDELFTRLVDEIDRADPEEILVASGRDWHVDHRALNATLRRALRRRPVNRVLEYPVWLWIHGPWDADPGGPRAPRRPVAFLRGLVGSDGLPRANLVSTAGLLTTKRRALLAHRSQTTNMTGEPGWAVLDDAFMAAFLTTDEVSFPLEVF